MKHNGDKKISKKSFTGLIQWKTKNSTKFRMIFLPPLSADAAMLPRLPVPISELSKLFRPVHEYKHKTAYNVWALLHTYAFSAQSYYRQHKCPTTILSSTTANAVHITVIHRISVTYMLHKRFLIINCFHEFNKFWTNEGSPRAKNIVLLVILVYFIVHKMYFQDCWATAGLMLCYCICYTRGPQTFWVEGRMSPQGTCCGLDR